MTMRYIPENQSQIGSAVAEILNFRQTDSQLTNRCVFSAVIIYNLKLTERGTHIQTNSIYRVAVQLINERICIIILLIKLIKIALG